MYGNEYYGSASYATTKSEQSTPVVIAIKKAIDKVVMLTKYAKNTGIMLTTYVKNKGIAISKIIRTNL